MDPNQPPAPHFTNIIIQQPGANNQMVVAPLEPHRDWSSELFGCLIDFGTLCKTFCCLDCVICGLNSRMGECACVHWLVPGALTALRTKIRTIGGIQGSMVNDCMVTSCCLPCAVCQMERELDAMGL